MLLRALTVLVALTATFGLVASASAAPVDPGEDCPPSMDCQTVTVPLDWTGKRSGKLEIPVQVGKGKRPLLLFLAGGPGQGFVDYGAQIQSLFDQLGADFRIAVLDQRGTGSLAIRCNRLQSLNLTDLSVRPRPIVRDCGNYLGPKRAFYSTTSTVRDLEAVRKAIGVKRMSIMGTSYGTYVAMRYARAYPNRINRLVLDSVVPQEDVDPYLRVHMRRTAKVLRWVCGNGNCGVKADPARLLRRLVSMPPHRGKPAGSNKSLRVDGPVLLDWMTTVSSFMQDDIPRTAMAIGAATRGNYGPILKVGEKVRKMSGVATAGSLSWGLHAATLCSDLELPYSIATANRKAKVRASNRFLAKSPSRSFWPFDRSTARNNGVAQVCLDWPATRVAAPPKAGRVKAPTLFLAGQFDLSTPVEYARHELRRFPKGKLVVVPKGGHSVAFRAPCVNQALASFLKGRLRGDPCRGASGQSLRAMSWTMPAAARWPSAIAAATDGAP